jgi:acetoin utilization protein AcuB
VGIFCDRDLRQAKNTPVVVHEKDYDDYILDHVQIGNAMTTEILTIALDDSLEKAARLMNERKIGGLPVIQGGKLVGILTESDLLSYLIQCLQADRLL